MSNQLLNNVKGLEYLTFKQKDLDFFKKFFVRICPPQGRSHYNEKWTTELKCNRSVIHWNLSVKSLKKSTVYPPKNAAKSFVSDFLKANWNSDFLSDIIIICGKFLLM